MRKENSVFRQLENRSIRLIQSYQNDLLVHDKRFIMESRASVPFIHVTRKMGTHLFPMYKAEKYPIWKSVKYLFGYADTREILESEYAGLEYSLKEYKLIQWYDGLVVRVINPEHAINIFQQWRRNITNTMADFKLRKSA